MTSADRATESPRRRSRKPVLLAAGALAVIVVAVVLVLILAGGNETGDGTGRDQQNNGVSPTNITNSSGNGAGGPVR